jgi:hypothetical protein
MVHFVGLDVSVKFLQVALSEFSLVPIVAGDASPEAVAALLDAVLGRTRDANRRLDRSVALPKLSLLSGDGPPDRRRDRAPRPKCSRARERLWPGSSVRLARREMSTASRPCGQ